MLIEIIITLSVNHLPLPIHHSFIVKLSFEHLINFSYPRTSNTTSHPHPITIINLQLRANLNLHKDNNPIHNTLRNTRLNKTKKSSPKMLKWLLKEKKQIKKMTAHSYLLHSETTLSASAASVCCWHMPSWKSNSWEQPIPKSRQPKAPKR